jgi:hypothetical protein
MTAISSLSLLSQNPVLHHPAFSGRHLAILPIFWSSPFLWKEGLSLAPPAGRVKRTSGLEQ